LESIDVNVPAGTQPQLPFQATVLHVLRDPSTEVGWGGRLVLQAAPDGPHIILGHLRTDDLPEVGEAIPAFHPLGTVGTWPLNGNVFEHLHIQLITLDRWRRYPDQADIDGYGIPSDLSDFPNPFGADLPCTSQK